MKEFLNRNVSLKQVLILVILLFGTFAFVISIYFSDKKTNEQFAEKHFHKEKDTVAVAIPLPPIDTSLIAQLKELVDSIAALPELEHGSLGFCLSDVDSGKVLCDYNSNRSLIPASVMKIVTTGAALSILGNNYHYATQLQYEGEIDTKTKTLNGNIYIKGSGDPSLGSDVFQINTVDSLLIQWTRAIKKLGIDSVNGTIIGDADAFEYDLIPAGWAWEDVQSYYCAPPCGLSFHENVYDIDVFNNKGTLSYKVKQDVPGLKLYNQLAINKADTKSYLYVSGAPYMNERYLLGSIAGSAYSDQSPIPDPPLFCAHSLYRFLLINDIAIKYPASTVREQKQKEGYKQKERKTFYTTYSPALSQLVYHTNHVSHNFYAESILKTLALNPMGYGTTPTGVSVVLDYWKNKDINTSGLCMVDGSGVSRFDLVTAKQLCDLLVCYYKDSTINETFYNSLPIAGCSGTMTKLCKGTLAEGNIRAKSGYMTRVRSYAGYVTDTRGRKLAFAVLANNYDCSAAQMKDYIETIMVKLAELD